MTKNLAIIIGVNEYQCKKWSNLDYIKNDLHGSNGLINTLHNNLGAYSFLEKNTFIFYSTDATSENVKRFLEKEILYKLDKEAEQILFYFSGHAEKSKNQKSLDLILYDTSNTNKIKNYISLNYIIDTLRTLNKKVIFFIDTCYSGHIIDELRNNLYLQNINNVFLFTSSNSNESSSIICNYNQSLFTYFLIEGLNGSGEALNKMGQVDSKSLKLFLENKMETAYQNPNFFLPEEEIILSRPQSKNDSYINSTYKINFHNYLESLQSDFINENIFKKKSFILIKSTHITSINIEENINTYLKLKENILKKTSSIQVLYGDVGSGKTILLKKTWCYFANKSLISDNTIIPLYINLKEFQNINSFDRQDYNRNFFSILVGIFQYNYGINLTKNYLIDIIRNNKVIFIFDGLDELGIFEDKTIIKLFLDIVNYLFKENAHIIISVRKSYLSEAFIKKELIGTDYHIFSLYSFNESQIDNYLKKMSDNNEVYKNAKFYISSIYKKTEDFIQKPFILESIINILNKNKSKNIKEFMIYDYIIKSWINRDKWRFIHFIDNYKSAIDRDIDYVAKIATHEYSKLNNLEKIEYIIIYFMEFIAYELYIIDKEEIYSEEILGFIKNTFPSIPEIFLSFFEYILKTCSFISFNENKYTFIHDGIHQYFIASAISTELLTPYYSWDRVKKFDVIPYMLGKKNIGTQIISLISEMLNKDLNYESYLRQYINYYKYKDNPYTLRYLPNNIFKILLNIKENNLVDSLYIKNACLMNLTITDANLSNLILEDTLVINCNFKNVNIKNIKNYNSTFINNNFNQIKIPSKINNKVDNSKVSIRNFFNIRNKTKMLKIGGDTFDMGTDEQLSFYFEKPKHKVKIKSFLLDEHPVTNRDFAKFIEANPYWSKKAVINRLNNIYYLALWNGNQPPPHLLEHPVVYVSWYAATAYAEWIGKRLPTEAEWEFALKNKKHNDNIVYPWDKDTSKTPYIKKLATTAIKKDKKNNYGLYDMTGNVNEWVSDWFDFNYWHNNISLQENPKGAPSGNFKILRGGSFLSQDSNTFKVYYRRYLLPQNTNADGGFRCAKDI